MARKEQYSFAREKPSIHVPRLGLSLVVLVLVLRIR